MHALLKLQSQLFYCLMKGKVFSSDSLIVGQDSHNFSLTAKAYWIPKYFAAQDNTALCLATHTFWVPTECSYSTPSPCGPFKLPVIDLVIIVVVSSSSITVSKLMSHFSLVFKCLQRTLLMNIMYHLTKPLMLVLWSFQCYFDIHSDGLNFSSVLIITVILSGPASFSGYIRCWSPRNNYFHFSHS